MGKIIIVVSIIFFSSTSILANSIDYSKQLQPVPSRELTSLAVISPKKTNFQSLIFFEGHNFSINPANKSALESLDFLISIKVPFN